MNLEALSFECRQNVLDMIMEGRAGHIGGDFSVMDILITLYFKQMNISPDNLDDPDRDLFVMSKGHSVEAYYAVLAAKGFLDIEDVIKNFSKFGSPYIGHPNNRNRQHKNFRCQPYTGGYTKKLRIERQKYF